MDLDRLVNRIFSVDQAQMTSTCAFALILWDTLITIDQEVQYVWHPTPLFTLINALFFLNRWWPIVTFICRTFRSSTSTLSAEACMGLEFYAMMGQIIHITVVESAMALRVWALYRTSVASGLFLSLLVFGGTIHMSVVTGISLGERLHPKRIRGCSTLSSLYPPIFNTLYYSTLIMEVLKCISFYSPP